MDVSLRATAAVVFVPSCSASIALYSSPILYRLSLYHIRVKKKRPERQKHRHERLENPTLPTKPKTKQLLMWISSFQARSENHLLQPPIAFHKACLPEIRIWLT